MDKRHQEVEQCKTGDIERLMSYERLVPVMTEGELRRFRRMLSGHDEAPFTPDTLKSLKERADERERKINARLATAVAKSDELCRQRTAKK